MAVMTKYLKKSDTESSYVPYIKVVVNSQSITNNTSNVTFTFGMYKRASNSQSYNLESHTYTYKINGVKYTKTVSFDFRDKSVGTYNALFSVTKTISHASTGKKNVALYLSHPTDTSALGTMTYTTSIDLPTIPRATTPELSVTSCNIGDAVTITLDSASSSFTHKLKWSMAGSSGTISNKTLSVGESFAKLLPDSTSGTCTITCSTYTNSGATLVGTKTAKLTIKVQSDYKPTAGISTSLSSALGSYALKNKSKVTVTATGTAKVGASIEKYIFTIDDVTKKTIISSSGSSSCTLSLTKTGTVTVGIKVVDSRGYSSTVTKSITVVDYSAPTVKLTSCKRGTNSTGRYIYMKYTYTCPAANYGNSLKFNLYYRKASATTYTKIYSNGTTIDGDILFYENSSVTFADENSYMIKVEMTDQLGTTASSAILMQTTAITAEIKSKGIGIGKYSEESSLVDSAWTIKAPMLKVGDHRLYPASTSANLVLESATGTTTIDGILNVLGLIKSDGYKVPRTLSAGSNALALDLGSYILRMNWGSVLLTATANTVISETITYKEGFFTATPYVTVSAKSGVPGSVVQEVSFYNNSSTGCTIYGYRTNSYNFYVTWKAISLTST